MDWKLLGTFDKARFHVDGNQRFVVSDHMKLASTYVVMDLLQAMNSGWHLFLDLESAGKSAACKRHRSAFLCKDTGPAHGHVHRFASVSSLLSRRGQVWGCWRPPFTLSGMPVLVSVIMFMERSS